MGDVAPELRSPVLPLTARRLSGRSLWMGRLGMRRRTNPGEGVTMTERHTDGEPAVRVLVTTPTSAAVRRPAVLHIHGGGMVVGSPRFEAKPFESGRLARALDAVIVSPDYRLAPEHPFPAALDDCMITLTWMRERADHRGRGRFMWTPASSRWAWTRVPGPRAAGVRGAGVCGARTAHRPVRPATRVARRGRPRHPLRGGRRIRRAAQSARRAMRAGRRARHVPLICKESAILCQRPGQNVLYT